MLEIIPDIERLNQVFSHAIAPTFFLGAVAAFVSLMSSRLSAIVDRMRTLNAIPQGDPTRAHLKSDLDRLRRRAHLLNSGIYVSLGSGICATLLLAVIFASEFAGMRYIYGAGLLFLLATLMLGFSLFRFAQEARFGLSESDEFD